MSKRKLYQQTCEECGGKGFFIVPDNGTNNGEETCDVCWGQGWVMVNEWGDRED
jgi:DnaJ-class molecular chaperone